TITSCSTSRPISRDSTGRPRSAATEPGEGQAMLRVLDRLMVYSYLKSYLICLVSLLALYIVVDLFMNVNDFAHANAGVGKFAAPLAPSYGAPTPTFCDRLSEMIVLLAAMFTIAWVQRNNELLPQLSAGVGTKRVVRPVLFAACGML